MATQDTFSFLREGRAPVEQVPRTTSSRSTSVASQLGQSQKWQDLMNLLRGVGGVASNVYGAGVPLGGGVTRRDATTGEEVFEPAPRVSLRGAVDFLSEPKYPEGTPTKDKVGTWSWIADVVSSNRQAGETTAEYEERVAEEEKIRANAERAEAAEREAALEEAINMGGLLAEAQQMLEDPNLMLNPEQRLQVEEMRKETEEQLRLVNAGIAKLQSTASAQNALMMGMQGLRFGAEGLLPGATDEEINKLERALTIGGGREGLGPEVLTAIDAIINSNMSNKEKDERLDFILDRTAAQQNMIANLEDFTHNRRGLEKLLAMEDYELLGDEVAFATPMINVDWDADPTERMMNTLTQIADEELPELLGVPSLTPQQEAVLINDQGTGLFQILGSPMGATMDDATRVAMLNRAAQDLGIPTFRLNDILQRAQEETAAKNQAWDSALSMTNFKPGSYGLIAAVYQVATEMGFPPNEAALIAESGDLHHLIDVHSEGRVGNKTNGNKQGIGGLTPQALIRMGFDPETTLGDTHEEIRALLTYVLDPDEFGSVTDAMKYYLRTGRWGE